jgi:hypothetical protein
VQIRYTKLDGMKCIRIISREQKATRDREQAELAANVDVLGLNAVQKSAKIAQKGEYTAGTVPACSPSSRRLWSLLGLTVLVSCALAQLAWRTSRTPS